MSRAGLSLLLCLSLQGGLARAAEKSVIQVGQTYLDGNLEPKLGELKANGLALRKSALQELRIKKGDSIVFKNLDTVTHNVYGDDFDLKKQEPGDSRSVKFDQPGEFVIRCMIHPKMKFKLKVE